MMEIMEIMGIMVVVGIVVVVAEMVVAEMVVVEIDLSIFNFLILTKFYYFIIIIHSH